MNLVFANLAMWPWMVLVSAPLLVHLFARSRPKHFPFSSVRLLSEIVRRTSRLQRPQSWLILLLRTLLFLALALMMLQPTWISSQPLPGFGEAKTVFLLIDRSASMAAQEGSRTRFAAATTRASEILSGLSGEDRVNVIWVGREAQSELPAPAGNRSMLREALQQASVRMETANWNAAFDAVRDQLRELESDTAEVHVISDFQRSNWENVVPRLPESARILWIAAAEEQPGNQTITGLEAVGGTGDPNDPVRLQVEVQNFSDEPVLRTLFLRAGEQVETREVRLAPGTGGGASFQVTAPRDGEWVVETGLDEDAFPYDDRRHLVLQTGEKLRVALGGADRETREAWGRALEAIEWIETVPGEPEAGVPDAAVWLLAGWDGERGADAVVAFREKGGGLIRMPEAGDDWRLEIPDEPAGLRLRNPEHPVVAIFDGGTFGDPAAGRVTRYFRGETGGGEVVLETRDGSPLLTVSKGEALWLAPLGGADWVNRPEFVPLLGELVLAMRGEQEVRGVQFTGGERLVRGFDRPVLPEELLVSGPEGELNVEALPGEGEWFATGAVADPGVYEWRYRGSRVGRSVVQFPADESDLRDRLDPVTLEGEGMVLGVTESVNELREGRPLWPWLLAAAMVVALMESAVVWRTQREVGA